MEGMPGPGTLLCTQKWIWLSVEMLTSAPRASLQGLLRRFEPDLMKGALGQREGERLVSRRTPCGGRSACRAQFLSSNYRNGWLFPSQAEKLARNPEKPQHKCLTLFHMVFSEQKPS